MGGNLFVNGEKVQVNPAVMFGGQQGQEMRAVGDSKMRGTNKAASIRVPIDLPSSDHMPQIAKLFRKNSCVWTG